MGERVEIQVIVVSDSLFGEARQSDIKVDRTTTYHQDSETTVDSDVGQDSGRVLHCPKLKKKSQGTISKGKLRLCDCIATDS